MCCCCASAKCSKVTLVVFSIFSLIMGGIILGLAFYLHGAPFFTSSGNENVEKIGDVAFYLIIIFGALCILTALLGFLTAWCNKNVCTGFYGVLSFIV